MVELEIEPFVCFADFEKKRHQAMYPIYIYCPRSCPRRQSTASTQKVGTSELTPTNTPSISSNLQLLKFLLLLLYDYLSPRATAQLVVQKSFQFRSISPSPLPVPPLPNDSLMQEVWRSHIPKPILLLK